MEMLIQQAKLQIPHEVRADTRKVSRGVISYDKIFI